MSQAGTQVSLGIAALTAEVQAALGYLPRVLGASVRERVYDMLSHHRLSVGKQVGRRFPGRRRAQQWYFSRSFRYTAPLRERGDRLLPDTLGEAFLAMKTGFLSETGDAFGLLERGGEVASSGVMAIPTGEGRRQIGGGLRTTSQFRQKLARPGGFDVSPGGALFDTEAARGGGGGPGLRNALYGVLRRRRHQDPILGWYPEFARVSAQHLRRMETDAAFAMDFAGRASLEERAAMARQERAVFRGSFDAALAELGGRENRRNTGKAARVAEQAVRDWRRRFAETRRGDKAGGGA